MERSILSSIFTAPLFVGNVQANSSASASYLEGLRLDAVISDAINPGQVGRAKYQGSWWPAVCVQNIYVAPGTHVVVVGMSNITLLVKPLSPDMSVVNVADEEKAYA